MVCQNAKRCFFITFLVLVVWFFFSLCFCGFVLFQIAQNGYFPAFLEVFCLFCSHKRPVLKCFFSSYFVFFCFCLPFQKFIFIFSFCPSTPFNKRLFVGFLLFFFCLSFPFLSFACLFDTNFPNIPFWNPICFRFCLFLFSSVVVVFFSLCMFQPFCFFVVMLALFWVFLFCFVLCFCFCSSFLFCFQSLKKGCFFSLQFWCFLSYVG